MKVAAASDETGCEARPGTHMGALRASDQLFRVLREHCRFLINTVILHCFVNKHKIGEKAQVGRGTDIPNHIPDPSLLTPGNLNYLSGSWAERFP